MLGNITNDMASSQYVSVPRPNQFWSRNTYANAGYLSMSSSSISHSLRGSTSLNHPSLVGQIGQIKADCPIGPLASGPFSSK